MKYSAELVINGETIDIYKLDSDKIDDLIADFESYKPKTRAEQQQALNDFMGYDIMAALDKLTVRPQND